VTWLGEHSQESDMAFSSTPAGEVMDGPGISRWSYGGFMLTYPPSGWCVSMAARLGKKIIYLPIGVFSPVTLKKMKEFHVLEGHHVRKHAKDYI